MKKFILIFILTYSQVIYSQNKISFTNISDKKFLVGSKSVIYTDQSKELTDNLLSNHARLILEDNEIDFQLKKVNVRTIKWTFTIPSKNNFVGNEKNLIIEDNSKIEYNLLIDIYSDIPELVKYKPKIIYNDVQEPQNITLTINNVAYIDKIEFFDEKIQIVGTTDHFINSSSYGFNIDQVNSTISLNVFPNGCSNFDLKFHYTNVDLESSETKKYELKIAQEKMYLHQKFKITTASDLYIDDFDNIKYKPKILFDFEDKGEIDKNYKINIESPNLIIKTLTNALDFKMPNERKIEVEIKDIKESGNYEIKIEGPNKKIFISNLYILPKPEIKEFYISGSSNYEIIKDNYKYYSLLIKGEALHIMPDLQLELVDIYTSEVFLLDKEKVIYENSISSKIKFDFESDNNIPIGKYYLRLTRENNEHINAFKRVYPLFNPIISIIYPKHVFIEQLNEVSLYKPDTFSIKERKRFKDFEGEVLNKNSTMTIKISDFKKNKKYGPQYLNIKVKYLKSNGSIEVTKITEGSNDFITIFDKPIFIDLRDELGIENFKVNEKVSVYITHSSDIYGSKMLSPNNEMNIYRGSNFFDKLGVTLSIPPYLAAFRNVKRKSVNNIDSINSEIRYDGEKKIEFQSLTINAGIGFKYRGKNKNYKLSKFALSLYLMGLDFANINSSKEQKADIENHNFIGRGSMNLLLLSEYSFLNIDKPNARIPVYGGIIYILDPLDKGPKLAPIFGFGIDIGLFGSN